MKVNFHVFFYIFATIKQLNQEAMKYGFRTIILLILSIIFCQNIHSQSINPSPFPVFENDGIAEVHILIAPEKLDLILHHDNLESYKEYMAKFVYKAPNLFDTIENVGFRLRGNTSRYSAKKSFKVSFNTFEQGAKYHGLEKMNINGEHNDPCIMRSKISFDILRKFGVPASRANHVALYINTEYRGLYINVEHIDEQFVDERFGNNDGNLYKCLWPADLNYISSNPASYKFNTGDRRAYALSERATDRSYSDIAHFIEILNKTPAAAFKNEIEKVFNVNNYIKYLAVEIFTGHWDGYSFNKNNFYLYFNTATNRFEFIPYDLDNTYGIDWFGIDWAQRNIYEWDKKDEQRPLTERILQNEEYRNRFSYYFNQLLNIAASSDTLNKEIQQLRELTYDAVLADNYRTLDYGWDFSQYYASFDDGLGGHVKYGLLEYLNIRRNMAYNQLNVLNIKPVLTYHQHNNPLTDEPIKWQITVDDESDNVDVFLHYRIAGSSNFKAVKMSTHLVANPNIKYSITKQCETEAVSTSNNIEYYFTATDPLGNTNRTPIEGEYMLTITQRSAVTLRINEMMAANNEAITDEYNEYDDWLEIYNYGNQAINLSNIYLTDRLSNPDKFKLPDYTINAGEYLLIWIDNDTYQGQFHAPFKLSANGETIALFEYNNGSFIPVDKTTFPAQSTNISYGRLNDGSNRFAALAGYTPGYANTSIASVHNIYKGTKLKIYPNPVRDMFTCEINEEFQINRVMIYNLTGELLIDDKQRNMRQIDISQLQAGIYFATFVFYDLSGQAQSETKKIVVI